MPEPRCSSTRRPSSADLKRSVTSGFASTPARETSRPAAKRYHRPREPSFTMICATKSFSAMSARMAGDARAWTRSATARPQSSNEKLIQLLRRPLRPSRNQESGDSSTAGAAIVAHHSH